MQSIIIPFLTAFIGYLARKFLNERTWKRIRLMALQILKEPNETDDPVQALEQATVSVLNRHIHRERAKLKPMLNGSHPYPKQESK